LLFSVQLFLKSQVISDRSRLFSAAAVLSLNGGDSDSFAIL